MTKLVIFSAARADTGEWTAATKAAPYCAHSLETFVRNHEGEVIDIWGVDASVMEDTDGWDIDGEYLIHHRTI